MTNASLNNHDLHFMGCKPIKLAGIEVIALRLFLIGDLSLEVYSETKNQIAFYTALPKTGKDFVAGPVGSRALISLSVEKGYGS